MSTQKGTVYLSVLIVSDLVLCFRGVDISHLLEIVGAPDSWVLTLRESKAGGIVTAYTMYKIATPARYTVTLGAY